MPMSNNMMGNNHLNVQKCLFLRGGTSTIQPAVLFSMETTQQLNSFHNVISCS